MTKNSTLQNDLEDTFSLWSKVNDTEPHFYPIVYNFFSLNNCTVFIHKDKFGDFLVCYTGLTLEHDVSYDRTQFFVYRVCSDYQLAQDFFRGLVFKVLKDLP